MTLIFVKGVIYMILHIWQGFRLSGAIFVRKVWMKFEYVSEPVFCEHNLPVEAHIHSCTFKWQNLEKRDPWLALQKSIFLCDYLAKSDGVFTELQENSHSFIIRFDFSDSIKGSFAIDTQMPVVNFFGTIGRYSTDISNDNQTFSYLLNICWNQPSNTMPLKHNRPCTPSQIRSWKLMIVKFHCRYSTLSPVVIMHSLVHHNFWWNQPSNRYLKGIV